GSLTSDEQALHTLRRIGLWHSGAFATISDKTRRNYSGDTCLQTVQMRNCCVVFACWTNSSDNTVAPFGTHLTTRPRRRHVPFHEWDRSLRRRFGRTENSRILQNVPTLATFMHFKELDL